MNKLKTLNNLEDIRLTKEFIFLNPYKFIAFFIYGIIALLLGVCVWLSFTNRQETIDVQGSIQLSDKVQDIQVFADGVIDNIYVQDGGYVEKGETILSLQSDKLNVQKEDLEKQLEEAVKKQNYLAQVEECITNRTNSFQNNEEEGYYYAQVENYLSQVNSINNSVSNSTLNSLNAQKQAYEELLYAIETGGTLDASHSQKTQLTLYQRQLAAYDTQIQQTQELLDSANSAQAEALQNAAAMEQYQQQLDPTQDTASLEQYQEPIDTSQTATLAAQYQQQLDTYIAERENFIIQKQLTVQQQIDSLNQQITQAADSNSDAQQQAQNEINNLTASSLVEVKNQLMQQQSAILECESSLASIDTDLNYYSVQATESGYIRYKGDIEKYAALSSGTVVGILTEEENQAENFYVTLNVPSSGIGFIKTGQAVKLTVDGLDSREYGYVNGKIQKIYETPIQTENAVYYQVEASVQMEENNSVYWELFTLKDDMNIQANIVTKETSWMKFLLQKINLLKDKEDSVS